MMATTHAFVGVAVGLGTLALVPEAGPAVLAGALGGITPDLDLVGDHRKDLHFPAYGTVAAALAVVAAAIAPSPTTVSLAVFLVAAALHAVSDVFGGDLTLRPWEATGDRAVYEHLRGRWHRPRRWIRYDGAPEDFVAGLALAGPAFVALDGPGRAAVAGLITVSAVYTLTRRRLVDVGERVVAAAPEAALAVVPETLVEDLR